MFINRLVTPQKLGVVSALHAYIHLLFHNTSIVESAVAGFSLSTVEKVRKYKDIYKVNFWWSPMMDFVSKDG